MTHDVDVVGVIRAKWSTSYRLARREVQTGGIGARDRGAVMILTFVIIFIVASVWDVRHVNRVLGNMVNPGEKQIFLK